MEVVASMPEDQERAPQPGLSADSDSFQMIFRTHYAPTVRRILHVVRSQAVAEDLAQEVFLRLYDQDWTQIVNIGAWLAQASLYAAYNYLRSEQRRAVRDEQQSQEQANGFEPSTEDRWLQQEEIQAVREALTDLSERDRSLLLLKYSGYNYQELAEATQVEAGSIGTLLARARKRFRDLYQRKRGHEV